MSETLEQAAAIAARGKVIVPASAGSGKTFVMVRRYVELVKSGVDVRSMLAVTFTNKAAAQMRDRIRRALTEAVAKEQGEARERLKRQLVMLPLADICTIHAFCGRLIRTSFWMTDVDPSFRVIGPDDAEGRRLSARALDKTFEDAYASGDEAFSALLAVYFRKKRDTRLRDMTLRIYESARGAPDYRETLSKIAAGEEDNFAQAEAALTADFRRRAKTASDALAALMPMLSDAPEKVQAYCASIQNAASAVLLAPDLFTLRQMETGIAAAPRRTAKTDPLVSDLITRARGVSEAVKELYAEAKELLSREEEYSRCLGAQERARALAALALVYDENYAAEKRDAGVLDYGDLEHLALDTLTMSEGASLKTQYEYVFVDEYQDVNPMQERILSELAERSDLFLVGDKKQAIYGFRGSRSRYFTEKEQALKEAGGRFPLSANFRSADAILHAVNTVFRHTFSDYEPMRGGGLYQTFGGEVRIHRFEAAERVTSERGVYSVGGATPRPTDNPIAKKVLAVVEEECGRREGLGKTWFDVDLVQADGTKGGLREVRYGDIAVLVRKNTKAASAIVRALSDCGIPVTSSAEVNVCDYFEARLVIDWLSYLDNAEQDIPMATAMLSVIGGFTDRELALIRIKAERVQGCYGLNFRDVCRAYQRHYRDGNDPICKKLERFFARAQAYRTLACVRSASEMIRLLLADGLEAQIAAKGESAVRLAHVRRLVAEGEGCGNIHAFLRRLKDCGERVDFSETGGENAVHVITMHAGKGLEFPVVILTELDEKFRGSDRDEIMWTDAYHIAPRFFDAEKKVYGETLIRRAAALYERQAETEGERNLLYVAMTRACCRLHLITEADPETVRPAPEDANKLSDFLPFDELASCFAPPAEHENSEEQLREALYRPDAEHLRALRAACLPYAHAESVALPVKSSATALMKNEAPMYEAEDDEKVDTMSETEDEFAGMGGSFTTDMGTAYHVYLQYADFAADPEKEVVRLTEAGSLSAEQAKLLDVGMLRKIVSLDCLKGIAGKRCYREQRFLARFPADMFAENFGGTHADDEIVFQGAIDLLVEEGEGRYTVIDYKFSARDDGAIRSHYAVQIKLYRKTVARAMGVAEEAVAAKIVNIARGRVIEM